MNEGLIGLSFMRDNRRFTIIQFFYKNSRINAVFD